MEFSNKKSDTYHLILKAAKQEFLEKGYEKASMRAIAGRVGITATALYRHFKDKEDIFSALVRPIIQEFSQSAETGMKEVALIFERQQAQEFWLFAKEKFDLTLDYIYDHLDEFQLLISFSAGTCYQNFRKEMIEREVEENLLIYNYAKNQGFPVKPLEKEDLDLIINGFVGVLFDLLSKGYSRAEARQRSVVIIEFFQNGLRQIFGF